MGYDSPQMPPPPDLEMLAAAAADWPAESRAAMLEYLRNAAARTEIQARYTNAAELAAAIDPNYRITPAIKLIADAIETTLTKPRHNLLITAPPQEGKSSLCAVYAPLRALQLNPNRRIILSTYGDTLAEDHSRACRDIVNQHGTGVHDAMTGAAVEDKLGFRLSPTSFKVSAWQVANARGGMIAVGLGSAITGRSADVFFIDDPYKNMMEADSASHRRKVDEWMSSVAMTRLSPGASMVLVCTRWHPEDLAGQIIAGEAGVAPQHRTWRHINIPAVSEAGIPDALGRAEPGEYMVSARGRTPDEFAATRRQIGERVWYALYQGSPRVPAGGLFLRAWFANRLDDSPEHTLTAVVGIDPADSGEGDETGIIGARLTPNGKVVLCEDWSAHMTSDEWSRQAVRLALEMGASEIAMEAYASATTYVQVLRRAYKELHTEALAKQGAGAVLTGPQQRALAAEPPFTLFKWRGQARADSVARSALLRQALETGTAATVANRLAVFEAQAADWQVGQHCPDRVSAAVIAHDRLAGLSSGQMMIAAPVGKRPRSAAPAWMRRKVGG